MQLFYITFGCDSRFSEYYYTISAVDELAARQQAFDTFGNQWAYIHDSPKRANVHRFNLKELVL